MSRDNGCAITVKAAEKRRALQARRRDAPGQASGSGIPHYAMAAATSGDSGCGEACAVWTRVLLPMSRGDLKKRIFSYVRGEPSVRWQRERVHRLPTAQPVQVDRRIDK